jgi:hypothetical protein
MFLGNDRKSLVGQVGVPIVVMMVERWRRRIGLWHDAGGRKCPHRMSIEL